MPVSYIQHRILSQLLHIFIISKLLQNYNIYMKYFSLILMYDIHPNPGPIYNLQVGYNNNTIRFMSNNN